MRHEGHLTAQRELPHPLHARAEFEQLGAAREPVDANSGRSTTDTCVKPDGTISAPQLTSPRMDTDAAPNGLMTVAQDTRHAPMSQLGLSGWLLGTIPFGRGLIIAWLSVALCLGCFVGWTSHYLIAQAPVPTVTNAAPHCGPRLVETICSSANDRKASLRATKPPNSARRELGRGQEHSRVTAAALDSADRKKLSVLLSDEPMKSPPRGPAAETKPTTVEGWMVRDVLSGRAVLEGPNGTITAGRGDYVPGLGHIDSIVRWGKYWIVSTTPGLISTQN
jgi:hypothetical protein